MKESAWVNVYDKQGLEYEDVLFIDHKEHKAKVERYISAESGLGPMVMEQDVNYLAAAVGGPIVNLYNRIFNK